MNITTTARHCEIDNDVRAFIHQRLEKLARFVRAPDDIHEVHLVVTAEKYRHAAEITLRLRRGEIVCREEADDPRAAIDRVADVVERQMRRAKDKRVHLRRGDRTRAADGVPAPAADEGDRSEPPPAEG